MSDEGPRRPNPFIIYGGALAVALALLLFQQLGLHGTRLPATVRVSRHNERPTEDALENVLETLRKEPGLAACRTAVAQLNGSRALPVAVLSDAERLRKEFHLDDSDLAELTSTVYTPLDAYYLDQCLLLHDAARSLGVDDRPAPDRAVAGFAWAMRQVRLQEADGPASPPAFVLRRGWGTARERSLVFLALLEQLGLRGCMVVLPAGGSFRDWVAAALADGQIYLFDSRLGMPLPGPSGKGLATLAQAKTDADLLKPLSADGFYDVDFAQARQAELRMVCPLSALAPRMRRLEEQMEAANRPRLATAAAVLRKEFQDAIRKSGLADCPVCVGEPPPAKDDALGVLRSFLADPSRQPRFDESLTPWPLLPASIRRLPEGSDLGRRLRQGFAKPFLDLAYDPRMPRELMLRGRLDEAVAGFVELRGEIERLRESARAEPEPGQVLEKWVEEARRAYAEFLRAQREAGGQETPALKAARQRMGQVWDRQRAGKPFEMLQALVAEPRLAQTTYCLALAKQELAERARTSLDHQSKPSLARVEEVKATWRAAADWWRKYLDDYPISSGAASAKWNQVRALEAQGQRPAAIDLLREPPADASPWEKHGFRLRAKQLQVE